MIERDAETQGRESSFYAPRQRRVTPTLDGAFAPLFRPDADGVLNRQDENLAVANLAGLRGLDDRLDCFRDVVIADHDFKFHLWQEIHRILAAAIDFSMPLLPSEPFHFADGHPLDSDFGERLLHVLH